jgi:guanylate kinase
MIIGICGKSGSGKDVIAGRIKQMFQSLELKSYTTRAMRPGEVADEKYHFCSISTFVHMRDSGQFAESVEYGGKFYGTTKDEVQQAIASENIYIKIATPSGLAEIEKSLSYVHLAQVYIDVDEAVRDKRFISRLDGKETEQDIQALIKRKADDDITFAGAKEQCNMVIDNSKDITCSADLDLLATQIVEAARDFYIEQEENQELV